MTLPKGTVKLSRILTQLLRQITGVWRRKRSEFERRINNLGSVQDAEQVLESVNLTVSAGELVTKEEKRLADRVSILQELLPPFVCAIYNGQARDWDRETVLSMLTGGDGRNGKDPPSRLTEDDVSAYIDKLFAHHESKNHT